MLAILPAARADFTGDFAPANWTLYNEHGSTIDFTGSTALTIVGPQDGQGQEGVARAQITLVEAGTLAFHYAGPSPIIGIWSGNRLGYTLNGTDYWLSPGNGFLPFSDDLNLTLAAGDVFAFTAWSLDSEASGVTLTITNFSFTAVPEPASIAALAGLGALGLATLRRRPRA